MHFEKFNTKQLKNLLKHYNREHITKNVIQDKIKDNQIFYSDYIKEYINNNKNKNNAKNIKNLIMQNISARTKRKLRDDSVVMVDLIITQPEYLGKQLDNKFFDTCINTFKKNYIKDNYNYIMSAIHQDEQGQPHCHISFIPIVHDKKKPQQEKLCCKEILTKDFLKNFHSDMEKLTGYKLTSEDKNIKNLSMQQYQNKKDLEKLQEQVKEQKEKIKELEVEKEKNIDTISNLTKKYIDTTIKTRIEKGIAKFNDCEIKEIELKQIEPPMKKDILGNKKIDNDKIFQWWNDTKNYINEIFSNYIFNLSSMKMKEGIVNKKAMQLLQQEKLYQSTSTENIKLKSENELLKDTKQKYNLLQISYKELSKENDNIKKVLKANDILDKVMELVEQITRHEKSQNQGFSL